FRERKHHLLPLHLFLGDTMIEDDHAATFEDNGVAIVEADFTTDNTTGNNLHRHDHELILHYIYTQCQSNHPISSLQPILNPPPQWANQRFNGHVFPEGTPNGIDLCVYFYHDAQDFTDVTKEMELLWKINAL
ncbi:uncharacterized protein BX664DRAFT_241392, partial [Halteromyces radiatus]|uniref:uncharacterized protein n=1 Tax=Halteromyces radiatus TaxID=101107 RepID=UPI00221E7DE0